MHELSFVFEIISSVQKIAIEKELKNIDAIVLEIGTFSSIMPDILSEYFVIAAKDTILENTKLKINLLHAKAKCRSCNNIFLVTEFDSICPDCKEINFQIISGKEFTIKELLVP